MKPAVLYLNSAYFRSCLLGLESEDTVSAIVMQTVPHDHLRAKAMCK